MKNASCIRLDHAMHIARLFWEVNEPEKENFGTYINYDIDAFLAILAVESHNNQCFIIAEDLGTVAQGFRETLLAAKILLTKELYFEFDESGNYKDSNNFEKQALCTINSHDLPTCKGYINFNDILWQHKIGIINEEQAIVEKNDRQAKLNNLMGRYNTTDMTKIPDIFKNIVLNSSSLISAIYLDDFTNETEQLNLPGTVKEHKNWSRRLSKPIEKIKILL
jgi:4-alpha-glucanotransferase